MLAFRITKVKYAEDLSGNGAALGGGRWNSMGNPMLYTSSNAALALLEVLVHLQAKHIPKDFVLVRIELPDLPKPYAPKDLPENWNTEPPNLSSQQFGDAFLRSRKALIMQVPSAVVPHEFNLCINPGHPSAKKMKIKTIEPFPLDLRLFKENP